MNNLVKPLDWEMTHWPESEDYGACNEYIAGTPFGTIWIRWTARKAIYNTPWSLNEQVTEENPEVIKQRLDADYQQKVLSCLKLPIFSTEYG
jgi:hypothetical protein